MYKTCILTLPPLFPSVGQQLLCIADVAYRRVEPHIEHLTLGTLDGHRDTPVEVTCNGAGLQAGVEPALALSINVAAPLFVVVQNPLLKPRLIAVERQIPVTCLTFYEFVARVGIVGIYKFVGRKCGTTFLTLVAIGLGSVTTWTFAAYVTVGEELLLALVVVLLTLELNKLALVVEFAEEIGRKFAVCLRCCA